MNKALLIGAVMWFATTCNADFENYGQGGSVGGGGGGGFGGDIGGGVGDGVDSGIVDGNAEEGRFLGLLKKGKGRVETYTNYVPYPYPVPVAVPVYQNYGHVGKLGLGKGLIGQGLDQSFGQGIYPGYPYQYSNIGPVGYGGFGPGFGPGYGYFK